MNKKNIIFIIVIISICFSVFVIIGSYFYIQQSINNPFNYEDKVKREFVIENGVGVKQIAAKLEKENLIIGSEYFEIYVWQKGLANKLQAGSYNLSSSMTILDMVDLFVGGKIIANEVSITIPEGYSIKDIDQELAQNGLIIEGEFIEYDNNFEESIVLEYGFLEDKQKGIGLQGYYFPDTYQYYNNASLEDIARKMLHNFDVKLTIDLREEIKRQNKTIFEVIILASIVEKEAGSFEDMGMVASVFQNRLNIGQALESDATINYITNSGRAQSTYADLEIESQYNTYKYAGLPPGPISNPGIKAIEAVIFPEKSDYFYFLTKKENGEAVFSKTYQEHLNNKYKYLQ